MEKEGKANIKFIVSVLFFLMLLGFMVFSITFDNTDGTIRRPTNLSINTTSGRNINFTFNVTWSAPGEVAANCSLWTNFSGNWVATSAEFNGTLEGNYSGTVIDGAFLSASITNGSVSWVNYTFSHDIENMQWDVACYNETGLGAALFFGVNRTLSIDTLAPKVIETADIFSGFNTSDATPDTVTINITDVNGTGANITDGGNTSLNISISNYPDTTPLRTYNASNENLTCSPTGTAITLTQCTLDLSAFPLTNGTKNLTVKVTDRAGFTNQTSFTFTIDTIPPKFDYYNFTNTSAFNASNNVGDPGAIQLNASATSAITQGNDIFAKANWTDNLTQPQVGLLQFYNVSTPAWQTINTSSIVGPSNGSWTNFSFPIPLGHDHQFEGANVSFRIIANDTLGNRNSSDTVKNFTIQINDGTPPTLSLSINVSGVTHANNTNISDTTPTIIWNVSDNNKLRYIAIQVDYSTDDVCNLKVNYSGTLQTNINRNGSVTVKGSEDPNCADLKNKSHFVRLTAEDEGGNGALYIHNFTVETGTPTINISTIQGGISDPINQTNITRSTGLNFTATDGGAGKMKSFFWTSSCNSTTQVVVNSSGTFIAGNLTFIHPFHENISDSSCITNKELNRTVTVTATDEAGNSVSNLFQFAVDDLGPAIAVHSPTNGQSFTDIEVMVNVSAFDSMNRVESIGYYLDGGLTIFNHTIKNGSILSAAQGQNTSYINRSINFTPGTHTIKITVNDTLGNIRNSSVITFTRIGNITFSRINESIERFVNAYFGDNVSNVSVRIKTGSGAYQDIVETNTTDNTFEILYQMGGAINVSFTEINGSAANWDKINITPVTSYTDFERGVQNNWTNTVLNLTYFNDSRVQEFISNNNAYYGVVVLSYNISNGSNVGTASAQEFWWIEKKDALTNRTNISQCRTAFTRTTETPCWNYTSNGKTIIQVPHFSIVVAVNDSRPPTVAITTPLRSVTTSGIIQNITVSSDTRGCRYILNGTDSSATTNISDVVTPSVNNTCVFSEVVFKNGTYNVTFNVTDTTGNVNITNGTIIIVNDGTPPSSGTITSSGSTTGAEITVTDANESVNVTVWYGTANNSLTSFSTSGGTDFAKTQTVTITLDTVTSAATYYYNVTLRDYNGNTQKNGTFTFEQTATAAAAAAAAAAAGGGGGGGAAPVSKVADSRAKVWQTIPQGSSISLDVDKATIAITSVAVSDVKSELKNVELEVQALTENPVTTEAAAKVYQYLRINKKNVVDTDAESLKIGFRVTKSWLTESSLASGDISLYRFADSKWNELTTRVLSTDATYVNYEADTPGFSSFAIGTKTGVVVEEEVVPEEAPEVPEEEAAPTPVEKPKPVVAPTKAPIAWIIAAIVIILGIILIVVYQKKKQQV